MMLHSLTIVTTYELEIIPNELADTKFAFSPRLSLLVAMNLPSTKPKWTSLCIIISYLRNTSFPFENVTKSSYLKLKSQWKQGH